MNKRELVKGETVYICYYVGLLFVVVVGLVVCAWREREGKLWVSRGEKEPKERSKPKNWNQCGAFFLLLLFYIGFGVSRFGVCCFCCCLHSFPIEDRCGSSKREENEFANFEFFSYIYMLRRAFAWIVTQSMQTFCVFLK